jgi:hypothetical protein
LLQRALGYNSFNEWKNVFDETTTRPTIGLRATHSGSQEGRRA